MHTKIRNIVNGEAGAIFVVDRGATSSVFIKRERVREIINET